jgi:o-succinylbenzoate synthase
VRGSVGTTSTVSALVATRFCLPLRAPLPTAAGAVTHRRGILIRLATDAGVIGIGEASPYPTLGIAALREVADALERVTRRVVGRTLDVAGAPAPGSPATTAIDDWIEELRPDVPPALACALETAAYDAAARLRGVPLAEILGTPCRSRVSVNATLGGSVPSAAAGATAARERGFRCVKLKVGLGPSLAAERERVAIVRRAIGPGVQLRLDANGAWDPDTAIEALCALREYDLELVEQPVPPGNLAAMRRVREAAGVPIAADEDVTDLEAAERVLATGAARLLVVKPMVVGGLVAARRIATLARAYGGGAILTTTIDSGIATAGALHLAVTLPDDGHAFGLATAELLAADIIDSTLAVRGGEIALPAGAGLGVGLDEKELERRTVADWTETGPGER